MTYIERSLAPTEQVLVWGRLHWIRWVGAWGSLLLLGILLIGVVIFFADWIFMSTTEVAITNRRLILKTGLIARHTSELELTSVEAVSVEQDWFGRLFRYGKIEVHGTGDDVWISPLLSDPVGFRRDLESALSGMDERRETQAKFDAQPQLDPAHA
ncbi:conserved hypothetical protein [uncultured Defluviicoccus sp.]|uniref:YdbS-like PH domain-containing protein n=1 Tax=metagenome TaxID=256318 RepID=A0A380T8C4_9ZZZZ|nr:conserved hypothetical protein [uncultured Defluviicoccus sp.]